MASEAMLALVIGAHALKDEGASIDIVAFSGVRDEAQRARFADLPAQGPHEAAQSENIAEAAALKDYDRVIVLVGNFHALTAPISVGGPEFEPMAMRLRGYGSVLSLAIQQGGGTSWTCDLDQATKIPQGQAIPAGATVCAAHPAGADAVIDPTPFIAVGEFPNEGLRAYFDGIFWVGPISASPPAFPPAD